MPTFLDEFPYSVSDIFPGSYLISKVKTWKEVVFLGKNNIEVLSEQIKWEISRLYKSIELSKKRLQIIFEKTGEDFKKESKRYENPLLVIIGVPENESWRKEIEPLDDESKRREAGSTTLNKCGWCKYVQGSLGRYSYAITGSCSLLSSFDKEVKFNTNCLLHDKTAEDFQQEANKIRNDIQNSFDSLKRLHSVLEFLKKISSFAKDYKPYLVNSRPAPFVGDKVYLYTGQWDKKGKVNRTTNLAWVEGRVKEGYRYQDGCITAVADVQIHDNMDYENGCGYSSGEQTPFVLSEKDFQFFQKAFTEADYDVLKFLHVWLENYNRSSDDFDKFQYITDLRDFVTYS